MENILRRVVLLYSLPQPLLDTLGPLRGRKNIFPWESTGVTIAGGFYEYVIFAHGEGENHALTVVPTVSMFTAFGNPFVHIFTGERDVETDS